MDDTTGAHLSGDLVLVVAGLTPEASAIDAELHCSSVETLAGCNCLGTCINTMTVANFTSFLFHKSPWEGPGHM